MEKKIKNLLGNYQVAVVFLLLVLQSLILSGTIEVAQGVNPLDAVWSLVAAQGLLLVNHQLDTLQVVRAIINGLQEIDFKDDRIDEGVDIAQGILNTIGHAEPANVAEGNPKGG